MSDISLNITWWQAALWSLAIVFWPLTLLAAGALLWWWRRRRSWPARVAAVIFGLLWLVSAATNIGVLADQAKNRADYESELRSRQKTLARSAVIDGIALPARTVLTHDQTDPNALAAVDLPAPTRIGGVLVTGHAGLSDRRLDGTVTLAANAHIGEAFCAAETPARFASGKLVECRLAKPSRIRGIPCIGDINLEVGVVCTLAGHYVRYGYTWRAGTRLTDFTDLVWFRIGGQPPTLRVFGAPLAPESEVQFNHGTLASVDLRSNAAHFRGCAFDLIMTEGHRTVGRTMGACVLPQAPGSLFVALPDTTISKG